MKYSSNQAIIWSLLLLLGISGCGEDSIDTADSKAESAESAGVASADQTAKPSANTKSAKVDLAKACPDPSQTVVGLCIGMSVAEVEAAIKAQLPDTSISQKRGSFRYTDGVQKLSTEPYVSQIFAENVSTDEGYEVYFTAPPSESQVMMIKRWQGAEGANFPPIDKYVEAMINKYGEPEFINSKPQGSLQRTVIRWLFPSDGANCAQNPDTEDLFVGLNMNPTIDHAARLRNAGLNPDECARILQAQLYAPSKEVSVTSVQVYFSDLALGANASAETIAWLESLDEEAKKARLENADAPKL